MGCPKFSYHLPRALGSANRVRRSLLQNCGARVALNNECRQLLLPLPQGQSKREQGEAYTKLRRCLRHSVGHSSSKGSPSRSCLSISSLHFNPLLAILMLDYWECHTTENWTTGILLYFNNYHFAVEKKRAGVQEKSWGEDPS